MRSQDKKFYMAKPKQDVVVFIIGMKVRKWWRLWTWLSVSIQMFRILKDLESSPQKGLLHTITLPNLLIQYWESYDHLYDYAIDPQGKHLGAWKHFNAKTKKTRAVGVFHETYVVPMDRVETAYFNMPPIGLSAVCQTAPFGKGTMTARQRLGVTAKTSTR
jgi:hypothetical protein